jgi:hypothetical protein
MCFHCNNGNPQCHIPTEYRTVYFHNLSWFCAQCGKGLTKEQARGTSAHFCEGRYVMITWERPELEVVGGQYGFGIWVEGVFRRVNIGALGKVITDLQEENANLKKRVVAVALEKFK